MKKILLVFLLFIIPSFIFASDIVKQEDIKIEKLDTTKDSFAANRKIFFSGSLGATFVTDKQEQRILSKYTEKASGLPIRFFFLFDNNFITTYNLNIDYFDPFANSLYLGTSIGSKKICQDYDSYVSFWERDYFHSLNFGMKVGYNFSFTVDKFNSLLVVPYINFMYESSGFNLSLATKVTEYSKYRIKNSLGIEIFFTGALQGVPFIFFEICY